MTLLEYLVGDGRTNLHNLVLDQNGRLRILATDAFWSMHEMQEEEDERDKETERRMNDRFSSS